MHVLTYGKYGNRTLSKSVTLLTSYHVLGSHVKSNTARLQTMSTKPDRKFRDHCTLLQRHPFSLEDTLLVLPVVTCIFLKASLKSFCKTVQVQKLEITPTILALMANSPIPSFYKISGINI